MNKYLAGTARGEKLKWSKRTTEGGLVWKALTQYYLRLSMGGTQRTGQEIEAEMAAAVDDRVWLTSMEWSQAAEKASL